MIVQKRTSSWLVSSFKRFIVTILKTFSLRSLPGMLLLDLFLECSNVRAARDALIENVGNAHTKKVFPDHTQIHRAFCPASLGSLSAVRTGRRQTRNVEKTARWHRGCVIVFVHGHRVRHSWACFEGYLPYGICTFLEFSKRQNTN